MQPTISVSQLIEIVNQTLEATLPVLVVEGEIERFKKWNDRLAFFDLKDGESVVNCMMPLAKLDSAVEDGMQVKVVAMPKVTKKGRFSLSVMEVEPSGEGALLRSFEILKDKLAKEGLFAYDRKRDLPEFPQSIGLVTSIDSAAYHDFIKILAERMGGIEVTAVNTLVQGSGAPSEIESALSYLNRLPNPVEVVVLTRGGGSLEDLSAFNTEKVARAVAGSRAPIITAVGHEIDTTLVDLVADVRAATPSDAARVVVPDKADVIERLDRFRLELETRIGQVVSEINDTVGNSTDVLITRQERMIESRLYSLSLSEQTLKGFDPQAVLSRGYAILRHKERLIRAAGQVTVGDKLMIQLAKGQITSEVVDVQE